MQSGDSWRIVTPTAAQLRVGKLLVDKIADQIFHRETKTINAEVSEIHAALCYANTQICGEAHSTFFRAVPAAAVRATSRKHSAPAKAAASTRSSEIEFSNPKVTHPQLSF